MKSLSYYITEAKGSKQMSLKEKISYIKKKIKEIDRLLKTDKAAPTAMNSRASYVEQLNGYKTVEKYLLNYQKMMNTRNNSEYDKLDAKNKKLLPEISKHFGVDNPWPYIKEYEDEYE